MFPENGSLFAISKLTFRNIIRVDVIVPVPVADLQSMASMHTVKTDEQKLEGKEQRVVFRVSDESVPQRPVKLIASSTIRHHTAI